MYELKVKAHFDAAHRLTNYDGKCHRTHGHRWDVQTTYVGEFLDDTNMLVDFKIVKNHLEQLLEAQLDHYDLNKSLHEENPTAEWLAKWIYATLSANCPLPTVELVSVTVWESPECSVEYYPQESELS
jgi:6-pyruvoyltetrahydropterin/6-carboxytetrahydropterin synthase